MLKQNTQKEQILYLDEGLDCTQNPYISSITPNTKIFAPLRKSNTYLFELSELLSEPLDGNMSIPLNVDTEYVSSPVHWTIEPSQTRKGITTQARGIGLDTGLILAHKQVSHLIPRHPGTKHGFHLVDYLENLGYDVKLERLPSLRYLDKNLYVCEFVIYAHFALAEMMMIAEDGYREDLEGLMAEKSTNKDAFTMQRRLRSVRSVSKGNYSQEIDNVRLPWTVTINGKKYAVQLSVQDTGALHGQASYKDLCEAVGIKLEDKDNFTSEEKSRMLDMAIDRPEDFDNYALGDLYPYDALKANADLFRTVYEQLDLIDYYEPPKLTIGATVKHLFQSALYKYLGISAQDRDLQKNLVEKYLKPVSASELRLNPLSTRALASKVQGGRCRNNRPLDIFLDSLISDIDISGCYGEGQRNQDYPIGIPEILEFDASSDHNAYWTLRQFLKEYGDELVPGLWMASITSSESLKYPQDFFPSWFVESVGDDLLGLAKYACKAKGDTDIQDEELVFNEEDGELKIFNHEVLNAVLTHDGLQWIENICSKHQRSELLDKLLVKVAVVYPKSWKVDGLRELANKYKTHNDKNRVERVKVKGRKRLRKTDGECHAWFSVNLGELLINDLLANRKLYPKKTPLNTLYKLGVNTLYGDMTSKFFDTANVVVGNNITARARALAWYMEKGFHGFQSITDGCAFELNRVVYPLSDKKLTAQVLTNVFSETDRDLQRKRGIALRPIDEKDAITLEWKIVEGKYKPVLKLTAGESVEVLEDSQAMDWINLTAMEHLRRLFPDVDVLHAQSTSLKASKGTDGEAVKEFKSRVGQFEFEAKDFYDSGVFHGSANYELFNPNGTNLKFRAYETKKIHEAVTLTQRGFEVAKRYEKSNPAKDFMNQLRRPSRVRRQEPFVKDAILKVSDYKNRLETWESLGLVPGDSFSKSGLMREFSISQFTFKTFEQYKGWKKAIERAKDKYGQSIERYFVNDDGTLNYEKMVRTVWRLIESDAPNPIEALDPHRNAHRDGLEHEHYETWVSVKEYLKTPSTLED